MAQKKRRFFSLLLSFCLFLGSSFPAAAGNSYSGYTDVPQSAWYSEAVKYVTQQGLFSGTSPNTFSPEAPMTRGMFIRVLFNKSGADSSRFPGSAFQDVKPADWFAPSVQWASANQVSGGTGEGRFSPEGKITREQMAVMLFRYARNTGTDVSFDSSVLSSFPDAGDVSAYAREAMCWAVTHRIINGSGGLLLPQNSATRAQVATVFRNADSLLGNKEIQEAYVSPVFPLLDRHLAGHTYRLPAINHPGEDAQGFNRRILTDFYPDAQEDLRSLESGNPDLAEYRLMDYDCFVNGSLISLVTEKDYSAYTFPEYQVYNFDREAGRAVTNEELLALKGLEREAFLNLARAALESYFCTLMEDALQGNRDNPSFMKEYTRCLEATVDPGNYSMETPLYLNEEGELCIIGRIYSLAGAGYYYHRIPLVQ